MPGKEGDQAQLRPACVLKFVGKNVGETLVILGKEARISVEKVDAFQNQVTEIDYAFLGKDFLIGLVNLGQFPMEFALVRGKVMLMLLPPTEVFPGSDGLVFSSLDQGKEWGKEGEGAAQGLRPQPPKGKLGKVIKKENALIPFIQDLEIRGKTNQRRVFPKDPFANGVVRGNPGIQSGITNPFEGSIEHFLRSLVGESEN
jgi:hypothetical protein